MYSSLDGILYDPFVSYGELDWIFELQEDSQIPKQGNDKSEIVIAVHKVCENDSQLPFFNAAMVLSNRGKLSIY